MIQSTFLSSQLISLEANLSRPQLMPVSHFGHPWRKSKRNILLIIFPYSLWILKASSTPYLTLVSSTYFIILDSLPKSAGGSNLSSHVGRFLWSSTTRPRTRLTLLKLVFHKGLLFLPSSQSSIPLSLSLLSIFQTLLPFRILTTLRSFVIIPPLNKQRKLFTILSTFSKINYIFKASCLIFLKLKFYTSSKNILLLEPPLLLLRKTLSLAIRCSSLEVVNH